MKKIYLVFRHEILTVVARPSFLITMLLLPALSLLAFLIFSRIDPAGQEQIMGGILSSSTDDLPVGYVDEAHVVASLPDTLEKRLPAFFSEESAREALAAGKISAFYIIPADYLESGELVCVQADYHPLGAVSDADWIEEAITYNLFDGDEQKAARFVHPVYTHLAGLPVKEAEPSLQQPALTEQRDPDDIMTFIIPYAVTFLLYIVIMGAASLMLNSIAVEKQNRVLEILLTSITPQQMMSAKMLALALVGLLQTLVWGASGLLVLRISGRFLHLSQVFQVPASILLWGILFFLLGYVVYAGLMAGLGALVPNIREASQVTMLIMMPLLVPLMLIGVLIQKPDGALATILSLFPLTSPVTMMTRLAATQVSLWQPLLAAFLLLLTAWLVMRAVAGLFRANILLTGTSLNILGYLRRLCRWR